MKEKPLSNGLNSVEALEYRDCGLSADVMQTRVLEPEMIELTQAAGVPEEEVARRVRDAREETLLEAEDRLRLERERIRHEAEERVAHTVQGFESERTNYFRSIEHEVVQLALAITRKIIGRETDLDPTLLGGLVRIALDRMQSGPAVRVRVAIAEAEHWRRFAKNDGAGTRWELVEDEHLEPGDCIVETGLGTADFSFEAQLRDVEDSFARLLAHRPAA